MSTETIGIILGSATALLGGIWKAVQWFINKRDEAQKKVFERRDKEREEIKKDISDLKKDVRAISGIILDCDTPKCETKKKLAEYWRNKDVA